MHLPRMVQLEGFSGLSFRKNKNILVPNLEMLLAFKEKKQWDKGYCKSNKVCRRNRRVLLKVTTKQKY